MLAIYQEVSAKLPIYALPKENDIIFLSCFATLSWRAFDLLLAAN